MVGALGVALPNATGVIGVSLSAPSGVVTHTFADTGAGLPGAACAGVVAAARVVVPAAASAAASEATVSLRPDIVCPFPRGTSRA